MLATHTTHNPPRTAVLLTVLILLLAPVATLVGLFAPGFYHDTAWMIPQARGQDLITLVVAEPLLLGAMLAARRGALAASLLWMGALSYMLYTYAMYSYTAYFNALFLVYVALFSASLFALITLLSHVHLAQVRAEMSPALPARVTAIFCGIIGGLFLVVWLGQIVPATFQGIAPEPVTLARTPTSAVHVQDLAVVIPLLFTAAVWLWQRRPWGVVLGAILLVLSDVILIALPVMGYFSSQVGIAGALDMFWVFTTLAVACLSVTVAFIARLEPSRPHAERDREAARSSAAPESQATPLARSPGQSQRRMAPR